MSILKIFLVFILSFAAITHSGGGLSKQGRLDVNEFAQDAFEAHKFEQARASPLNISEDELTESQQKIYQESIEQEISPRLRPKYDQLLGLLSKASSARSHNKIFPLLIYGVISVGAEDGKISYLLDRFIGIFNTPPQKNKFYKLTNLQAYTLGCCLVKCAVESSVSDLYGKFQEECRTAIYKETLVTGQEFVQSLPISHENDHAMVKEYGGLVQNLKPNVGDNIVAVQMALREAVKDGQDLQSLLPFYTEFFSNTTHIKMFRELSLEKSILLASGLASIIPDRSRYTACLIETVSQPEWLLDEVFLRVIEEGGYLWSPVKKLKQFVKAFSAIEMAPSLIPDCLKEAAVIIDSIGVFSFPPHIIPDFCRLLPSYRQQITKLLIGNFKRSKSEVSHTVLEKFFKDTWELGTPSFTEEEMQTAFEEEVLTHRPYWHPLTVGATYSSSGVITYPDGTTSSFRTPPAEWD